MIDVAIIGGGPAGTAAALEACRRGLRAAVWERERFPRDKVCGEFLSAESLPLLESDIPGAMSRGALITRAEFISSRGRVAGFPLPRAARGLSRRVLDEALWQAAASSGAQTREGELIRRVLKLAPRRGQATGWELETGAGSIHTARALVVACGRWWTLEGLPSPTSEGKADGVSPWLGVKAHFSGLASRDAVEVYFFPGGYCGLAPIEDGLYNACCLLHRSLVRDLSAGGLSDFAAWIKAVARHSALDARLRGATQTSETIATAPFRPGRRRAEHEGALLAGDAAGVIDPFTGDGISRALHSGRLAAEELARAWSEETTENVVRGYRQRLGHAVRRSYTVAGLLRPLVSAPACVQDWAAAAIPWLGARLLADTRWHVSQEIAESISRT